MRVGVTLPQFRTDPTGAFEAARAAEELGLDGVFVFDHLWAIGQPDRPALACWPLLGALATQTRRVTLGTLVARVSLAPDAVLAHQFETLARIADAAADAEADDDAAADTSGPSRIIAGLGTGDRLSEAENVAYGIPFPPLDERLAQLADCARRTKALGLETWVGGRSRAVRRIAADPGIGVDALNLWNATPQDVRDAANHPGIGAVTWGGGTPDDSEVLVRLLHDLAQAGAQWAVCGPRYKDRDPSDAVATVAGAAKAISLAP